jgi:SAM-dependent methyltransferase
MKSENDQMWSLKVIERDLRDREASLYEATISPVRKVVESLAILRRFQTDASDVVLDIGTGTGRFMQELVRRGCSVVGLDLSRSSLIIAKKRCNCEVVLADLCHMPFRTHSFDKSIFVSVFQHVHPSIRMLGLSEIKRVNKKDAKILLTVYNYNLWHLLKRQRKEGYHPGGNYFYRFNFVEARALLASTPLQVESINGIIASDALLRTAVLQKLNLARKRFTPTFLKAIITIDAIMERIIPLSFLFGIDLRVICKTPI